MLLRKIKILLLLFLMSFSTLKASETNLIGKETPLEDLDHSGKQSMEWEKVQVKLATSKGELDAQENVLNALKKEKANLKGQALLEKIEELKTQQAKFDKMSGEYLKDKENFLSKYPEKGLRNPRIYKRTQNKKNKEPENEKELAQKMDKLHEKILNQYPKSSSEIKKNRIKKKKNTNQSDVNEKGVTEKLTLDK